MRADWPIEASVVLAITSADTVAATPVVPPPPALKTVVISSSRLYAVTDRPLASSVFFAPRSAGSIEVSPPVVSPVYTVRASPRPRALTTALSPMVARVVPNKVATPIDPPTPVVPPPATPPAASTAWMSSCAFTPTLPSASTPAWLPIMACTSFFTTATDTAPPTPVVPPPPKPTVTEVRSSEAEASMTTSFFALTCVTAPSAMPAVTVFAITSVSSAAPTPVVPPPAPPPVIARIVVSSLAVMATP